MGVATAAFVLCEVGATFAGQAGERGRLPRSVAESILLVRRRDGAVTADRGTNWIVTVAAGSATPAALAFAALAPPVSARADDMTPCAGAGGPSPAGLGRGVEPASFGVPGLEGAAAGGRGGAGLAGVEVGGFGGGCGLGVARLAVAAPVGPGVAARSSARRSGAQPPE